MTKWRKNDINGNVAIVISMNSKINNIARGGVNKLTKRHQNNHGEAKSIAAAA